MRSHAKASSAGSTQGSGKSRARTGIAFAMLLALLAFIGSSASPASAAVSAKGVTGFFGSAGPFAGQLNTPRGVAVNQASGDVYVAEGENNRVSAFDASGGFLRAFGANVVAYGPGDNGTKAAEICVPANGDACERGEEGVGAFVGGGVHHPQGIAVSQASGDVYLIEQNSNRVSQFDADGNFIRAWGRGVVKSGPGNKTGAALVQSVTVRADSGSFQVKFEGSQTTPLPYNASAAAVEAALNLLPAVGAAGGSIAVTGGPGDPAGSNPYVLTFGGSLAENSGEETNIDATGLGISAGTVLTCTSDTSIPAGQETKFQWLRNDVPIAGAETTSTETGTLSATYVTTGADAGAAIQCKVFKLQGTPESASSVQVSQPRLIGSPVAAAEPPLASLNDPKIQGPLTLHGGTVLTCELPGEWDGKPSFAYQWYRNAVPLSGNGANTSKYEVQAADLASPPAFQCAVTGTNAGGSMVAISGNKVTSPPPSGGTPGGEFGGSPNVNLEYPKSVVATLTQAAVPFEVCDTAAGDACYPGSSGGAGGELRRTFSGDIGITVAPEGAPNADDVLVTDPGNSRVQEYEPDGTFVRAFGFDVTSTGPGDSSADETQTATVEATGGKFSLSFEGATTGATGKGSLTSGSNTITGLSTDEGAFVAGQVLTATGIPAGTTITTVTPGTLTLSAAATASGSRTLTATDIPYNASAAELQATLDALPTIGGAGGSVTVSGGPGDATGTSPYAITFEGTLGGDDVAELTSTTAGLTGTATVEIQTTTPGGAFEVCSASGPDLCKAGTAGNGPGQFAASSPTRIAEDANGNIYTVEGEPGFRVQKFTLPGNVVTPQGGFDEVDLSGAGPETAPIDVAVDPTNSNLLVARGFGAGATPSCPITGLPSEAEVRVLEVSPGGALEGTHGTCAGISNANGIAVRGSSGNVYLSSTSGDQRLYVFNTGQPVAPTASITNVSDIGAHTATVNGLINPGGPELPYGQQTTYKVEYKRSADSSFSSFFTVEGSAGNATTAKAITASLDGLDPSTSYDVRITANKGFGSGSASQTDSFTTAPAAPQVALPEFPALGGTEAILSGSVNPNGQSSAYRFEYTDQADFEANGFDNATQVPATDAPAGSGVSAVAVSEEISSLTPGAAYAYRLLASNPSGQGEATGSFIVPDPAACPNAALRAGQESSENPNGSTYLPSCMALEMVSPQKKLNQEANRPDLSASGDAVLFHSIGALAETPQQMGPTDAYVATRGAGGWTTHPLSPPPSVGVGEFCGFSPDLRRNSGHFLTRNQSASAGTFTAYLSELDGSRHPLSPLMTTLSGSGSLPNCQGASTDASKTFFGASGAYFPGDPAAVRNVYEVALDSEGNPGAQLLTRDKDGKVWGGICEAAVGFSSGGDSAWRGAVSPDASRVYFSTFPTAPAGGCRPTDRLRVMKRLETSAGPVISEVSGSECARVSLPCDPSDGSDMFRGASQEGDKVLFVSPRQLTGSDLDVSGNTSSQCYGEIGIAAAGCDLYLYDASRPAGARLTQASAGDETDPTPGKGAEVLGLADMAGDGSHVYFVATGALSTTPNELGQIAEAGQPNLYLYERDAAHPGGRTAFIATLSGGDRNVWRPGASDAAAALAVPVLGDDVEDRSVGGDGHVLVFLSSASLTPDDSDGGNVDLYRYDSDSGALERVSRAAPGGADNGPFDVVASLAARRPVQWESFGRGGSEDGRTIVFLTREALDPADTDGEANAYIWHAGTTIEIRGSRPVTTFGAFLSQQAVSLSGEEVAFASHLQLLPGDGDTSQDIYVARTDGGYPPPVPPTPCSGEACQGTPSPQSPNQGAASETFSGPGNAKPAKPKKHRKHRKKHRHHSKRAAHTKQGGQK